jgi:hypothetical protein
MAIPFASFLFGGSLAELVHNQFFLGLLPRLSGDGLYCVCSRVFFFCYILFINKKKLFCFLCAARASSSSTAWAFLSMESGGDCTMYRLGICAK